MLKPRNFLASALVCAALTACADGPTLTPEVQAPESPAFDGGHMLGSAGVSTETTAGDSTTAARGGHMLGSGG